ncbi:hypothetical protein [Roseicella aquatilis]|uniref:IS3 family transposase n=1 Tax=Roseicella aquatilis TaxID=2527868 RepID=A0A4R4DK22_9PROT|nr:hypothetical protein [Roseicella aquatilis]TCZ60893.1 hypothetical protein EXY23_14065 [Roseicella aquatilis]
MVNYAPAMRGQAVRMVLDQAGGHATQREAIVPVAAKIGYMRETPRRWVWQAEQGRSQRPGLATDERVRLAAQDRENRGAQRHDRLSSAPR